MVLTLKESKLIRYRRIEYLVAKIREWLDDDDQNRQWVLFDLVEEKFLTHGVLNDKDLATLEKLFKEISL